MKVRVVIEEVVVDAECNDTRMPGVGAADLVKACAEEAVRLHNLRNKVKA